MAIARLASSLKDGASSEGPTDMPPAVEGVVQWATQSLEAAA